MELDSSSQLGAIFSAPPPLRYSVIFGCHRRGTGVAVACREQKPEMLLKTLQSIDQTALQQKIT